MRFATAFLCALAAGVVAPSGTEQVSAQQQPNASSSEEKALTARQILDRVDAAYASCKTYRDTGVVRTVYFTESIGKHVTEEHFATAFVRPERFRFQYFERKERPKRTGPILFARKESVLEDSPPYIVWRDGKDIRTWWHLHAGIEAERDLSFALAGATGVSGGSAHTVPSLLMPTEISGRKLTALPNAVRVEDSLLGQTSCYRIDGTIALDRNENPKEQPTQIWIDRKTFLILRIDEQSQFDDFRTEETTTYEPAFDGEIPEELLAFGAPEGPK